MTIKEKITSTLTPVGLPLGHRYISEPNNTFYITYFIYDIDYERCDDKYYISSYTVQVDLWSKTGEYQEHEQKIKSAMEMCDFYLSDEEELYEYDTKLFHKGMRFILENLENLKEVE